MKLVNKSQIARLTGLSRSQVINELCPAMKDPKVGIEPLRLTPNGWELWPLEQVEKFIQGELR